MQTPFIHIHPYPPFIPEGATKLIVGTLPPPRFSTGDLKPDDVNFCYGSRDGMLWKIIDQIFDLNLKYETTEAAIQQRKSFLIKNKIGIGDIVHSCERHKIDASDAGMKNVISRDLLHILKEHPSIKTLLFMGGDSKNAPAYFFKKLLKEKEITIDTLSTIVPRQYSFLWTGRTLKMVLFTAPSGAANRAIGSLPLYKDKKAANPNYNTFDFRVEQYLPFFKEHV